MPVEFKVDLDQKFSPCRWAKWCDRAAWVFRECGITYLGSTVMESNAGYHVRIVAEWGMGLRDWPPVAIAMVQSLLGSDFRRETFNLSRILRGDTANWNVLFTEKVYGDGSRMVEVPKPAYERVLSDSMVSMREEVAVTREA